MGVGAVGDYQWLANFGFAAVVAMYVLLRLESTIKELTKAVQRLTVLVAKSTGQDIEQISAIVNGGK